MRFRTRQTLINVPRCLWCGMLVTSVGHNWNDMRRTFVSGNNLSNIIDKCVHSRKANSWMNFHDKLCGTMQIENSFSSEKAHKLRTTLCKTRWKLSQPVEALDECWAVWYELFPTKPLLADPANRTLMLGGLSILRAKIIKPPTPPLTANILSKWYCRKSSERRCVVCLFQMKFHTNQHKILKISPNNVSSLSRPNISFRVW